MLSPFVLQAPLATSLQALQVDMEATPQGSGSVWTHCQDVRRWAIQLSHPEFFASDACAGLRSRLPWLDFPGLAASLPARVHQAWLNYMAWHDCGKPYVAQKDDSGRWHFPGHAEASAHVWRCMGGCELEQELMRLDMHLHTMGAEEVPAFAEHPLAVPLLLSAIAAVQANAEDFGGVDSPSYKAKLKHLGRRGKALLARATEVAS